MYKNNGSVDPEKHPWCFIGGVKDKRESFEAAMRRLVKEEMGINIENINLVLDSYYHAKLTDDNVNKIERAENKLLDFFSLNEIKKLLLSSSTEGFITKCGFKKMEMLLVNA